MVSSKKQQLTKIDIEEFCIGGIDKWACLAVFFIMLFVISVYCLYFFDPVESVDWWGLGFLVCFALFSMWGHIATIKYRIEIDNEKISFGSFRTKHIYFTDINEIKLWFHRGIFLFIVNKKGNRVRMGCSDLMRLVKILKSRVPRNQVMYREGDSLGNWIEQIIK